MEVTLVTYGLAALAGVLTMLNPCVLPVLPVIAGAAAQRSFLALAGLGLGIVAAFVGLSLAVITGGDLLALGDQQWRIFAASLMLVFGVLLASSRAQSAFSTLTGRVSQSAHGLAARISSDHPAAQAGLGLLLGIAWTPCVGPTLGAAMGLAATGESVGAAAGVMTVFGVFAVVPLVGAGVAARGVFLRDSRRAARWAAAGRRIMGVGLVLVGVLILTGLDKELERLLIAAMPDWLLRLTTRF